MDPSGEPGDRRAAGTRPPLERPPGERYQPPDGATSPAATRSTGRALGLGLLVALLGAAVLVVLGGVFALSAGLLVVAGVIGWAVGRVVAGNAGAAGSSTRIAAVALALGSVALGQVGLWLHSLGQGGALGPVEYLAESRGLLVPAELLVAAVAAWWNAR